MLTKQFPDIQWLKAQIRTGFENRQALNDIVLAHSGWPNVVLNAKVKQVERKDIKGPFSLFMNTKGNSLVQTEGKQFQINELCYGLSNAGQYYDLIVDELTPTETFNVHFGEHFFSQSVRSLSYSHEHLIDDPLSDCNRETNLSLCTMRRTDRMDQLVAKLNLCYTDQCGRDREEEILYELLEEVLISHSREFKKMAMLSIQSVSTRKEIVSRLLEARDFIHAHYAQVFSLDELSEVACLSKFHFLRLFKTYFQATPYQYQKQLRLQRAQDLYGKGWTLESIAPVIGLENGSSVSRMFRKETGQYPSQLALPE